MTTQHIRARAQFRNKRKAISPRKRFSVLSRDGFACRYCGVSSSEAVLQVDHIEPVCLGGGNEMENLVTACRECNIGKGGMELLDVVERERKKLWDIMYPLLRFKDQAPILATAACAFGNGLCQTELVQAAKQASSEQDFIDRVRFIEGEDEE